MAFFKITYNSFAKRPFLLIYISAVSLLYSVVQLFNPIISLFQNLGAIRSDSWTDSMIYISKELYTPSNLLILLPVVGLACLILAVISGLVSTGYMSVFYGALTDSDDTNWQMILDGIKKSAIRVSLVFLQIYVAFSLFLMLLPVATVPTIILQQKAIDNGSANIFITTVLPILTIAVFILAGIFLAMVFIFRFPAIYYIKRRPIERAMTVVATAYWRYFLAVGVLMTVFVLNEYLLLGFTSRALEFIIGWITHTVILTVISAISFTGFHLMMEKFRKPS